MIDIRKAQLAGHAALRHARAAKESDLAGHPRIGSVGCVADDGTVYGVCPRIALARQLGIETKPALKTQIMWKAGEANEDTWNTVLDAGLPDGLTRNRDGISIAAYVDGVLLSVLGHPDVVYEDSRGVPVLGIELKGVFGRSTAVLVAQHGHPKNENLIQAAAYSHFMGKLDWALCYTSASYVSVNGKSIEPFYRTFYLEWTGPGRDRLCYRDEDADAPVETVIMGRGIEDYYRLVQEMQTSKDLGPRPSSHYVDGTPNKYGRDAMCGLCEFRAACDRYDGSKDYGAWLDDIKQLTGRQAA